MEIPQVVTEGAVVPLAIAGTQLVKMYVPERLAPVIAMVLAMALTLAVRQTVSVDAALIGFTYGLAANGLYSGVKALSQA